MAALTFINAASADTFASPRAADARHSSISTGTRDVDKVHKQTELGNAAKSKAMGHAVVAGSSKGDTDTLHMVKNCHLSPKQIGDTPACRACCAKTAMN